MTMELNGFIPEPSSVAIRICNAHKEYNSHAVLKNLNMTIQEGTIYGLLGPSGCGKTTVINCIVGQMELDSGSIETSATKRSDIGYMPQTTSLHDSLSVYENISFFGFLIGMSEKDIRTKADELIALLEIPPTDRLVRTLSGGQQRRVTVVIALLHDPKILLMDEPTVGLDPIMSRCIWNYLLKLAASGKSILITTHYIEETRQTHMIGILREGVILAEESPVSLMEQHFCENLEDVFLKLTLQQETKKNVQLNSNEIKKSSKKQVLKKTYQDDHKFFSLKRFQALMYKNVMLLKGDRTFLSFLMILPILQLLIFNLAIGTKPKNLQIAVVNEDSSCTNPYEYRSCFSNENSSGSLSCLYLDLLRNHSYNLMNYDNLELGRREITDKSENIRGLLHFDKNFSKTLGYRLDNAGDIGKNDIQNSYLEAWIDNSDQYIGSFIKYDMALVMLPFLKEALLSCNLSSKLAYGLYGINVQTPIYGSEDTQFTAYSAAAMICLCSMFYPCFAAAMYVQQERVAGIINRMAVSGATMTEILLSIGLAIFSIHIIQTAVNLFIMFVLFSNELQGSLVVYSLLQLLIGSLGIIYGFVIALITDEIFFVALATTGSNMILCLTTGLIWPTEAAHYTISIINRYCLPLLDSVIATRGIALKNYGFSHPIILKGYFSIVVWNFVWLFVLIGLLRLKKNVLLAKAPIH